MMERRQFLEITGLSFGGYLLLPGGINLLNSHDCFADWWRHFQEVAGARLMWPAPDNLQDTLDNALRSAAYAKYRQKRGSWRSFGDGRFACCAIELSNATTGVLDLSVPVYEKKSDGEWQQLVVLSAYHLEAIAGLANQYTLDKPLDTLVLPVGSYVDGQCMGSFYPTAAGIFGISPQLTANGMDITTVLYDKNGKETVKWRQPSAHQLV